MSTSPVGIFDSGLGGLSVWKACKTLLPDEQFIYVADQAHCPYGPRPASQIKDLSRKSVEFLLKQRVKLIVVACNTATAAAIHDLRQEYSIPFVGMEPAIKPAALQSITKTIGILATKGTFQGKHFKESKKKYADGVEVLIQVGEGLVELVETGKTTGLEAENLLHTYLDPMKKKGVDQLVLGCTHYPFLMDTIQKIMGNGAHIIDPAPAVALQVKRILSQKNMMYKKEKPNSDIFFTTGSLISGQASLDELAEILGQKIRLQAIVY